MDTVPEVRYVKSDIFQEELSARIDDRTSKNFLHECPSPFWVFNKSHSEKWDF